MLATVRGEVLALRRDIAVVLTRLLIVALKTPPEDAKRMAGEALTTIKTNTTIEDEGAAQNQRLRAELLALRRDVAVVMAKLFLAAGRSGNEVEDIILTPLGLRKAEREEADEED